MKKIIRLAPLSLCVALVGCNSMLYSDNNKAPVFATTKAKRMGNYQSVMNNTFTPVQNAASTYGKAESAYNNTNQRITSSRPAEVASKTTTRVNETAKKTNPLKTNSFNESNNPYANSQYSNPYADTPEMKAASAQESHVLKAYEDPRAKAADEVLSIEDRAKQTASSVRNSADNIKDLARPERLRESVSEASSKTMTDTLSGKSLSESAKDNAKALLADNKKAVVDNYSNAKNAVTENYSASKNAVKALKESAKTGASSTKSEVLAAGAAGVAAATGALSKGVAGAASAAASATSNAASGASATTALLEEAHQAVSTGNYDKAASALERAHRIEPKNGKILFDIAQIRYAQGEYRQAASFASRAIDSSNDKNLLKKTWSLLANARQALGDNSGADLARKKAASF